MADNLSASDLRDILAALKELNKPYELGLQLSIDSSELDEIEKNRHGDTNRQKTEVIKYWLRNSPDLSWTTLANAVERMGGHARLVEELRGRKEAQAEEEPSGNEAVRMSLQYSFYKKALSTMPSPRAVHVEGCTPFNVLLLGKIGHGKSTLGNRMLDTDGCFKINNQQFPKTCNGSAILCSASQRKDYLIRIFDHDGLFESANSIDTIFKNPQTLDLVIFVLKRGCSFDIDSREILKTIVNKWKISWISALVLTHYDDLSEEEREKEVKQYKKDHPSVAELMGQGVIAVGFPDNFHVPFGSELSQMVEDDKTKLKQLIYSSKEGVNIPSQYPTTPNNKRCCSQCSIL